MRKSPPSTQLTIHTQWIWIVIIMVKLRRCSLEKEMATHSSILAGKITWTKEPGRLQSVGLQRIEHDWATKHMTLCHWQQAPTDGSRDVPKHLKGYQLPSDANKKDSYQIQQERKIIPVISYPILGIPEERKYSSFYPYCGFVWPS